MLSKWLFSEWILTLLKLGDTMNGYWLHYKSDQSITKQTDYAHRLEVPIIKQDDEKKLIKMFRVRYA